jgi:hypothetical protein
LQRYTWAVCQSLLLRRESPQYHGRKIFFRNQVIVVTQPNGCSNGFERQGKIAPRPIDALRVAVQYLCRSRGQVGQVVGMPPEGW